MKAARWNGDEWRWHTYAHESPRQSSMQVIEDSKTGNQPFGFSRALQDEQEPDSTPFDMALAANGIEVDE